MEKGLNSYKVLVLNTTFVPINICNWKRAIKLVYMPVVVKLFKYVPLPYNEIV